MQKTLVVALALAAPTVAQKAPTGYTDTPKIPGQPWKVHDDTRPRPEVVTPATPSTQEKAGKAPSDAVVLFDGTNLAGWLGRGKQPAKWKIQDGYVEVNGSGPIRSRETFGDCQLHIEWQSPNPPKGHSQGRGNSGVFLMNRYEIQVLDSFDNKSYADGQASALYGQHPPLVNACRKPGEWQTYDILFTAPRFEGEKLVSPAFVTVLHNGVLVHNHQKLLGQTTHKKVATYKPHPPMGPIQLQDHGNPVRFRNIWVRRLGGAKAPQKPPTKIR